ncbi:VanZ family protein [Algoriphagus winogradskyi]|uniref:VanZ like family protein n=1 Tax=Algoriphagus winogradskyi TaxID=237017 RepID=A0ABY1NY57_9BACT|nr:VanZ family protein [Algoriphagus winogradskyi]SMP21661.1 VanZ like family protein [Algoriphagus winogradskyi]
MRLGIALVWLIFIAVAMLTPGNNFPEPSFQAEDKLVHFVCFGLLSFLWCGVGIKRSIVTGLQGRVLTNYLIFGVAAGIVLECAQLYIPFRSFDYMDMIVNEIGGLAGLLAYFKIPTTKIGLE